MVEGKTKSEQEAKLQVLREYVKDLSFEIPTPHEKLPNSGEKQTLEVAMDPSVREIKENEYEVTLYCSVKVVEEKKKHIFVFEIKYSGVFQLINLPKEHHEPICMVDCAHLLFPSVRFWVSNITAAGSFPPVKLPPSFDFRAIYSQKKANESNRKNGSPN